MQANDLTVYEENMANRLPQAKMVFEFNDEFVEYNPELAGQLLAFNAAVLGTEIDPSLMDLKN